jgi:hypothetical protein
VLDLVGIGVAALLAAREGTAAVAQAQHLSQGRRDRAVAARPAAADRPGGAVVAARLSSKQSCPDPAYGGLSRIASLDSAAAPLATWQRRKSRHAFVAAVQGRVVSAETHLAAHQRRFFGRALPRQPIAVIAASTDG